MSTYKLFVIALVLVIGSSVLYILSSSGQNLDVSLSAPVEAMIGSPFDFKVEFSNQLSSVIKNVSLIITLPDGAAFSGSGPEKLVESKNLGDLGSGSLVSENYKIVFLKNAGSSADIKVLVSYNLGSSKYEQEESKSVKIGESGVKFEFTAPEKVSSGEEFSVDVKYKNVSDSDFSGLVFSMEYPASFAFASSDSKPDSGNNIWELGDLRKNSEGHFTIKGSASGPDNSELVFKPKLAMNIGGKDYSLELGDFKLSIAPSLLSLGVAANNKQDYVAKPGETLAYVISYINNSDTVLKNVIVRARLSGEMFNVGSLNTKAGFRSLDNTLIWNSGNTPELLSIAPRSAGFVSFNISAANNYPIRRLGDKNFTLSVKAEIEAPAAGNVSRVYNASSVETKIAGNLVLSAKAYFRDADSGILNKGIIPPKAGQPVNFTIHWILKSFAADFGGLEVRAQLANGVKFTGVAKSDYGNAPVFDLNTNEMVWTLDKLPANKGFVDDPAEAVFQIEATPSAAQIANYMPLIGDSVLKAIDSFTSAQLELRAGNITTALPDDSSVGQQGGVVQP